MIKIFALVCILFCGCASQGSNLKQEMVVAVNVNHGVTVKKIKIFNYTFDVVVDATLYENGQINSIVVKLKLDQ